MIRLLGIDHLVLRIRDADAMLHFYCDVLGCVLERRKDDIGLIQLRAGRSLIDLVPVDGAPGSDGARTGAGIWGRIDAGYSSIDPDVSTSGTHFNATTWRLQAGFDALLHDRAAGALIGGTTCCRARPPGRTCGRPRAPSSGSAHCP